MSYTDLRDFHPEAKYPIPATEMGDDKTLVIAIEKLGGGTIGESYSGTWRYQVWWNDVLVMLGQDMEVGMPITHVEAARLLASFLADYGDPDGYSGESEISPVEMNLCKTNHYRFYEFGNDEED